MHRRGLLKFAGSALLTSLAGPALAQELLPAPGGVLPAPGPQPGDTIVTGTAVRLQSGTTYVDRTEVGITLEVLEVKDDWIRVVYHVTGWMNKRYAVPLDQAVDYFSSRIAQLPNEPAFYNARGNTYSALGSYDEAIGDFRQALTLRPGSPWIHNNCGIALMRAGKYEEAITEFTVALVGSGKFDAIVHVNRGMCYAELGAYLRARMSFNMAMTLNPFYPPAYERMAWLETQPTQNPLQQMFGGNAGSAVAYATKACELTKFEGAKYLGTLAACHAMAGNFTEAVKYQTEALRSAPPSKREEMEKNLELYKADKVEPGTV